MNPTFKSQFIEIVRLFIFGAFMLFMSSQVPILWIIFLILLIIGLLTHQYTYLNQKPVDRLNIGGYQFNNLVFILLILLVFGYRYFIELNSKPLIEKIYWPVFVATYFFNLKMAKVPSHT